MRVKLIERDMSEGDEAPQGDETTQTVKNQSFMTYRVGGRDYPLIARRRCKVCQSPSRLDIETSVVYGSGFQAAAEMYGDGQITGRNVRTHFDNGHLPLTEVALAKVKKKRALKCSEMIESGASAMSGTLGKAEVLVDQATLRLIEGDETPTIHEGLQAAKLLARAEESAAKSRVLSAQTVIEEVMRIARTELSPPEAERLRQAISQDPSLRVIHTSG